MLEEGQPLEAARSETPSGPGLRWTREAPRRLSIVVWQEYAKHMYDISHLVNGKLGVKHDFNLTFFDHYVNLESYSHGTGRPVERYTTEKIRKIGCKLSGLPPVERTDHSTRQAIGMLAGEIRKLQARGYTLDQIAAELRGEGLGIATPTLAAYLRQGQRKPAATRKAARARKAKPASGSARGTFTPPDDPDEI